MGGLVSASKDLDHQLLHGGFRGNDGQRFQAGTRPYSAMLRTITPKSCIYALNLLQQITHNQSNVNKILNFPSSHIVHNIIR